MTTYTVTSYSAFRKTERIREFSVAIEVANHYAAEGNLPSTIMDEAGNRWVVWSGQNPDYYPRGTETEIEEAYRNAPDWG